MTILLFYIYTPLENLPFLKKCFRSVCDTLHATGRLLISREGVNGTVALLPSNAARFKEEFIRFVPAARGNIEWKESMQGNDGGFEVSPFVDMKIAIVKELVGWGWDRSPEGKLTSSDNVDHLTPLEFHKKLLDAQSCALTRDNTILMDMRNFQESSLGHFKNAVLPPAKNMSELGAFLQTQAETVHGKTVLMYCTGGIRCEKASLYLDTVSKGKAKHIYQLRGGIHKYLEQFGDRPDCQFVGKNFVFDKRGCGQSGRVDANVGLCQHCQTKEPHLTGCAVCVVCRFQLLLCQACLPKNGGEHFCFSHQHLSECYSMFRIPTFSKAELKRRISMLKEKERILLPDGRRARKRRRTIRKCYTSMEKAMREAPEKEVEAKGGTKSAFCRASGKPLDECAGDCWGFFGQPMTKKERTGTVVPVKNAE